MHASLGTLSLSEMSDVLAAMPESACWDAPHTLGAWAAEHARANGLAPADALDVCLEQQDSLFRMACVHGAVWSALSHYYRHTPDATSFWRYAAEAVRVARFESQSAMLAHLAHGVGHGAVLGVMARAMPSFSACTPFTSVDVTDEMHAEAAAVCDAAPTRQLAHLCAGGAAAHRPDTPAASVTPCFHAQACT